MLHCSCAQQHSVACAAAADTVRAPVPVLCCAACRAVLLQRVAQVRGCLCRDPGGIFVLDLMGGHAVEQAVVVKRRNFKTGLRCGLVCQACRAAAAQQSSEQAINSCCCWLGAAAGLHLSRSATIHSQGAALTQHAQHLPISALAPASTAAAEHGVPLPLAAGCCAATSRCRTRSPSRCGTPLAMPSSTRRHQRRPG